MKPKSFEDYVSEQFWKQYRGLDDEAPEAESDWISGLEPEDWLEMGQKYGTERALNAFDRSKESQLIKLLCDEEKVEEIVHHILAERCD